MAIQNASAAQLITLRQTLAVLDRRLQHIVQFSNTAAYRNTDQLTSDNAAVTSAKAALDAVAAA